METEEIKMARLTYKTKDGSWGLRGVPWTQLVALPPRVYGALAKLKDMEELVDQINDPAGGRNGQADLAMEDLLGHGETRTKEGRELGTEWIMKRFCRIE